MAKSYLKIIIIVFLIVVGGVLYYFSGPKIEPIGSDEAALIVNFGETKRAFAGETIEGMTVSGALFVSARAGDFDFDLEGGVLKRIDRFAQNEKKWNVYFNGTQIEDSPDKVLIKTGDKVELRFE